MASRSVAKISHVYGIELMAYTIISNLGAGGPVSRRQGPCQCAVNETTAVHLEFLEWTGRAYYLQGTSNNRLYDFDKARWRPSRRRLQAMPRPFQARQRGV